MSLETNGEKPAKNRRIWKPINVGYWCIGVCIALVTPWVVREVGILGQIDNSVMALGFDEERANLIDYMLLILLSSLFVGFLLRSRSAAWIGSMIYFITRYLWPFVLHAQHPELGPNGQPLQIMPGALESVLLTLLAVAFLFSGSGAVLGEASGQVVLKPFSMLWKRLRASTSKVKDIDSIFGILAPLILSLLLAGALVLSSGIVSLLTYGPTTNLYQSTTASKQVVLHGKVQQGTFSSFSLGGIKRQYWIYLPPSYEKAPAQHYPTFYLLHGSPGDPSDWFRAAHVATTEDDLVAEGKAQEMILVGADGNGSVYRFSEWANSFDGRQRMEDAIARDLVSFIDNHYRTIKQPSDRAIGGISMGGYGAVNIALHYPDVFHKVMTLGGYFQADGSLFGPNLASNGYWRLNSPLTFLTTPQGKQAIKQLVVVIGIGTTDEKYYQYGQAFYRQLNSMKVPVYLFTHVGGHAWPVWTIQFAQSIHVLCPPHT